MSHRFPARLDPWRMVASGGALSGQVPLRSLKRLSSLLATTDGEARFSISFGRDDERRAVVHLKINAELALVCQRCMQPMIFPMAEETVLGLVRGMQEAEQLPPGLDPLLLEDETALDIADLIEDELILAVPVAPKHEHLCVEIGENSKPKQQPIATKENPFAMLAALKDKAPDR